MAYPKNSWAILPASCLFNKTKVTLEEVREQFPGGTVVVCRKPNGLLGFIAGCAGSYAEIGSGHKCHHDQTLANLGYWQIVAEVTFVTVDEKPGLKVLGSIEDVKKATIHVFK